MTDRKRDPLPKGYQYGDAGPSIEIPVISPEGVVRFVRIPKRVLAWNVIEADHFDADCDPGDETPWAV